MGSGTSGEKAMQAVADVVGVAITAPMGPAGVRFPGSGPGVTREEVRELDDERLGGGLLLRRDDMETVLT